MFIINVNATSAYMQIQEPGAFVQDAKEIYILVIKC